MNPRGGEHSSQFESPAPGAEIYSDGQENAVEAPVASPESSPSSQTSPPLASQSTPIIIPDTPAPVIGSDDNNLPTVPVQTTDHKDQIEKQWLERAKSVVAVTKDDPFKQKAEMSKVKAEYIQKKFNKKIRVDDAVA